MNQLSTSLQKGKEYLWCLRENWRMSRHEKSINQRIREKISNHEKIRVVFVCHRPAVWGALKTAYEAFARDPFFETLLVTVPQLDLIREDGSYDSAIDTFFASYHPIRGYDQKTGSFLDLETLAPDIVFFQQPYDIMRPVCSYSDRVSAYAKIGYVCYFSAFSDELESDEAAGSCYPCGFFQHISYFFAQNESEAQYVSQRFKPKPRQLKILTTGYPKYDGLDQYIGSNSSVWSFPDAKNTFRILWTPRWTTNENNCHFFDYKDHWFDYCKEYPDTDFVFRPHPQAWLEWEKTGEFSPEAHEQLEECIAKTVNMNLDQSSEYLSTMYSSDVLVTDLSSLILQYYLTEKPIIFCYRENGRFGYSKDSMIGKSMYWAENWNEVNDYLTMLKEGRDPLKEFRKKVIRDIFKIDTVVPAGEKIKNAVKEDLGAL